MGPAQVACRSLLSAPAGCDGTALPVRDCLRTGSIRSKNGSEGAVEQLREPYGKIKYLTCGTPLTGVGHIVGVEVNMDALKEDALQRGVPANGGVKMSKESGPTDSSEIPVSVKIQIDRDDKVVSPDLLKDGKLTGDEIRHLGRIAQDRDLFEVVLGGSDRKIGNDDAVEIRNHMRFFTAPVRTNPGCGLPRGRLRSWARSSQERLGSNS